jgi:hypothetical protein
MRANAPAPDPTHPICLKAFLARLIFAPARSGSILTPAAYQSICFTTSISPRRCTLGYQNPQSVLFQRRPDLNYLPLICENTNAPLLYIDIVNETLEYFIANTQALTCYQG